MSRFHIILAAALSHDHVSVGDVFKSTNEFRYRGARLRNCRKKAEHKAIHELKMEHNARRFMPVHLPRSVKRHSRNNKPV